MLGMPLGAVRQQVADHVAASDPHDDYIRSVVTQNFAATGTYTPTAGMKYAVLECQGGGGGGGGAVNGASGSIQVFGGPGGGGEYSRIIVTAAQVGASQAVTVGAAGAAGTNSTSGGAGGNSSVGTLCTAVGGAGGTVGTSTVSGAGGAGGSGGTGSQRVGQPGGYVAAHAATATLLVSGPAGGSSFWSGGAPTAAPGVATGYAATGFGGGGGAGESVSAGGANAGSAGSIGYVRITEYVG